MAKRKKKAPSQLVVDSTKLIRAIDITPVGSSVILPRTISPAKIPTLKDPTLKYVNFIGSDGDWRRPEYPIEDVGRLEDLDSFVRQAYKKKIGLMFKEGYEFIGKNLRTIQYVKTRFRQMAAASQIPEAQFLREIGTDLIKRSNCVLIKVRKPESSGGRARTNADGRELDPVAAYFPAPVETMEVKVNDAGRIVRWRQNMPDGTKKEFSPDNVIHMYFDRKKGFLFGTPTIVPVVDDIRALRQIEQNVELLIYQHLFPLFHYKVGTDDKPAGITEDGLREVDVVKEEIQYMPSEGGIVTPERHEIRMIGVEGRVLNAEKYLEYYKKRVLAGLAVSELDMATTDTANRSTSETVSKALIDEVKDFQDVLEIFFNELVIRELLLESTFGEDVLDDPNIVKLKFYEIDIDKRIKLEAHAADQFAKHMTTWPEARKQAQLEPVEVPPAGEDFNEEDFPDWQQTSWKLFEEPKAIIAAKNEAYLQVAAGNSSTALGQGDLNLAQQKQEEQQLAENEQDIEKEKLKGQVKVAVARARPKKKDFILSDSLRSKYNDLLEDTIDQLSSWNEFYFDKLALATSELMISELTGKQRNAFMSGFTQTGRSSVEAARLYGNYSIRLSNRANMYVARVMRRLSSSVRRNKKLSTTATDIRSIFDSLKFRLDYITDVELRKAYNLGYLVGKNTTKYQAITTPDCDVCRPNSDKIYDLKPLDFDSVVPFHNLCKCVIRIIE